MVRSEKPSSAQRLMLILLSCSRKGGKLCAGTKFPPSAANVRVMTEPMMLAWLASRAKAAMKAPRLVKANTTANTISASPTGELPQLRLKMSEEAMTKTTNCRAPVRNTPPILPSKISRWLVGVLTRRFSVPPCCSSRMERVPSTMENMRKRMPMLGAKKAKGLMSRVASSSPTETSLRLRLIWFWPIVLSSSRLSAVPRLAISGPRIWACSVSWPTVKSTEIAAVLKPLTTCVTTPRTMLGVRVAPGSA